MNVEQYMRDVLDSQTINGKFRMPETKATYGKFSAGRAREYLIKTYPTGKRWSDMQIDTGWDSCQLGKLLTPLFNDGTLTRRNGRKVA